MTSGADESDAPRALAGDGTAVQAAFEHVPLLVLALAGPEHRIAAANAASRSALGRSDLIGMLVADVLPDLAAQQVLLLLDRVYASGQAETGREWRIQLGQSAGQPAEIYVDFSVQAWRSAGQIIGLIATGSDVTTAVLARRVTRPQAIDATQHDHAGPQVVARLQQELLPSALPALPQARIAARYLVAGDDQTAGGDWFDALPLADGRVVLVIGDVVGHGIAASAAMSELRAVLNELLVAEPNLSAALVRLNALAARKPALRAATLALAALQPADGTVHYVTCGHPAPMIVGTGSAARFLRPTPGGPLGTGPAPVLASDTLRPGELLLLYSDGLVERPGRTLTEGMTELAAVAADTVANRALPVGAPAAAADRVCQQSVELLTRTGYADDVTVVTAERLAVPVPSIHLELAAEAQSLTVIRRSLRGWLADLGPVAEDYDGVLMAVVETVTNAIEHAYPAGQPGPIEFDLVLHSDGQLECLITDHGTWRAPDPAADDRGNGLMVAEHMVDQMLVSHPQAGVGQRPGGTVVRLMHRMRRPVIMTAEASSGTTAYPDPPPFTVETEHDGRTGRARVLGPVDMTTADEFLRRLLAVCRGGTLPLIVDLSGVTQLASAGVSALFHLASQLAGHHNGLELVTRAGGAVQSVLELVGLRYTAMPPAPARGR